MRWELSSNLAVNSTGRKQVRLNRVEIETADGACMSLVSEYQRFREPVFRSDLVCCPWIGF
jgi:hypothetical protein